LQVNIKQHPHLKKINQGKKIKERLQENNEEEYESEQ
jgi:hypothetical protein